MGSFIQYDLATNFDEELIDFIIENDKHKQIKSVFGKLKTDITGGGRAAFLLPDIDMAALKNYIEKCSNAGIEFNYLINSISLNDSMINPARSTEFMAFIDELYGIGVRSFTVNSPLLCKYLKGKYSDVRITVGLYAYPTSIQMIQYWVNNGADEITLDHAFNRDIPLLRTALKTFKDTDIKLRLIANNFCLHGCVSKIDHACHLGCASTDRYKGSSFVDYHLLNCVYNKVSHPAAMLSSDWIRPEDVKLYKDLMDETGNYNLTLKLVERTRTTDFLKRVTKAYLDESFDGNLLDIMNWSKLNEMAFAQNKQAQAPMAAAVAAASGAPNGVQGGPPAGVQGGPPAGVQGGPPAGVQGGPGAGGSPYRPEVMMKYGRCMRYPDIVIDNRKLDGFMSGFFKMGTCSTKLCGASILPEDSKNPALCTYCKTWADKAISSDPQETGQWLAMASDVLKAIEDRSIFSGVQG